MTRRLFDGTVHGYYQAEHQFDVSDESLAGVLPRVFAAFEMLALTGAVEFPPDVGETHAMVQDFYDAPAPGPALIEELRDLARDLRLTSRDLPECRLSAVDVVEPFRFERAAVIPTAPSEVDAAFASFRTQPSEANALCVHADGGVIVAGRVGVEYEHDMAVVRFLPDGRLDERFGVDGWAVIRTRGDARARAVVLQPDGRVVMAGESLDPRNSSITELALARVNSDGTVDASFNDSGVVLTTFLGSADRAFAVAIQDDGMILAAGEARREERVFDESGHDWFESSEYLALARYNQDGSLDETFATGGRIVAGFGGERSSARALAVQPTGEIVVAGFSKPTSAANADFAAARYDRSGNLDRSFGTGGMALFDLGSDDIVHAVALAQDGKLVLAGAAWHGRDDGHFALVRLAVDGRPDPAFNGSGALVVDSFVGAANDVTIDEDGTILAAGYAIVEGHTVFAVVRCLDDGRLDDTFGVDGVSFLDLGGVKDVANAIALDTEGRVLLGGTSLTGGSRIDFALARLPANALSSDDHVKEAQERHGKRGRDRNKQTMRRPTRH